MTSRPVVLITGARAPAALDLARAFAAAGYAVHMADCAPCRMARWSRAPVAVHAHASPVEDPAAFERDLRGLVDRLRPDLIVPTCEEVFHLAGLARRWPDLARRLFAPDFETLRTLHSKRLFAQACAAHGLPVPQTWSCERPEDLAALPPSETLVFKPEYSRFGVHTLVQPDPGRLAAVRPTPDARWVAQRHVAGVEVSFYAACRDGELSAFSAYGSRWRERGGASYGFEAPPAPVVADLLAIAEVLARAVVRNGQFACDAIVDAQGQAWLLECNPRATSGAHLFGRSADLALALAGDSPAVRAAQGALCYLAPAYWLFGLPDALGTGRLGEWWNGLRVGRDVIGAPGDRWPVFGALVDSLAFSAKALAGGQSLAAAMTADIEWNGGEP
jgi:hypothetical protein